MLISPPTPSQLALAAVAALVLTACRSGPPAATSSTCEQQQAEVLEASARAFQDVANRA